MKRCLLILLVLGLGRPAWAGVSGANGEVAVLGRVSPSAYAQGLSVRPSEAPHTPPLQLQLRRDAQGWQVRAATPNLDLRWRPHGPDDPTAGDFEVVGDSPIGPLFLVGLGLAVVGGVLAGVALGRNKAMREATSRQELDRIFKTQQGVGSAAFISLGAAVPMVVLNFVVQR